MGVKNLVTKMTYQVLPIAFAAMEPDIMVIQLWFLPFKAKLTMRLFESALSWFSKDHQTVFSGWLSRDVGNLWVVCCYHWTMTKHDESQLCRFIRIGSFCYLLIFIIIFNIHADSCISSPYKNLYDDEYSIVIETEPVLFSHIAYGMWPCFDNWLWL